MLKTLDPRQKTITSMNNSGYVKGVAVHRPAHYAYGGYSPCFLRGAFVGEWLHGIPYDYQVVDIQNPDDGTVIATLRGNDGLTTAVYDRNVVVLGENPSNGRCQRSQRWETLQVLSSDQRLELFTWQVVIPIYEALVKARKTTSWGDIRHKIRSTGSTSRYREFVKDGYTPTKYDFIISGQEIEYMARRGRWDKLRREYSPMKLKNGGVFPGLLDCPIVRQIIRRLPVKHVERPFTYRVAVDAFRNDILGMLDLVRYEFIPD